MAMESLLQVKDLTVRYGPVTATPFHAVEGVSFDIASGEVLGVMGESGCGKTSVALALLDCCPKDRPTFRGRSCFAGKICSRWTSAPFKWSAGQKLQWCIQSRNGVKPVMSVGMQIAEVVHAHGSWNWKRCRGKRAACSHALVSASTDRIFRPIRTN